MPPPAKPKGTGFRLARGVPVESLRRWEPPPALAAHCRDLLGLAPDGGFRRPDTYLAPEGTDARDPNGAAE